MVLLPLYNKAIRLVVNRNELPYIHMRSGAKFRHQWPLPEDVFIEDIAHNLSKLCRYAGSIEGEDVIYSVAEHCVRCSFIEPEDNPLYKLLHDSPETYVVDVPRPLKHAPFMGAYRFYEDLAWDEAIAPRFGLTGPKPKSVKYADKVMLVTEKRDLFWTDRTMCLNKMDDAEGIQPLQEKITPWPPAMAEKFFLMRFYQLGGHYEEQCHRG